MKKLLLTTSIFLITMLCNAQEKDKTEEKDNARKTLWLFKYKMGFSELTLYDLHKVNGAMYQFDLMLSSRLSERFRLEYGLGTSEFRGNHIVLDEYTDIKNQYVRVPVNLMYTRDILNNVSIISGIGFHGSYLYSSKTYDITEKNVGLIFGVSLQYGVRFKINDDSNITLSYEFQSDCNKSKTYEYGPTPAEQRISASSLLSLGFVHKL
ncbi:hypothetical protein [Flavobacterium sp. TBRC 19031]|uniref:hypothetical protein n=1 Tax=Flavobacterium mekongense TaxID=3379707 RepID=UPI00399A010D